MPTADRVRAFQALRGRFLDGVWDAEDHGQLRAQTNQVLSDIGETLTSIEIERLLRSLTDDGLIAGLLTYEEGYPFEVQLTPPGRAEVERWIMEPASPTKHLPITRNTVLNIINGPVTGSSFVQSSEDVSVQISGGSDRDLLRKFTAACRTIASGLDAETQEDAAVDLDILEEQAEAPQPSSKRVKSLVRRLMNWTVEVAADASSSVARAEVEKLGHHLLGLHS